MARPPGPPDLSYLARPGAEFAVHAKPNARRPSITQIADGLSIAVTAPPADGRANAAIGEALAAALGVARSRLSLVRGASSRHKVFRLD